MQMLSEDDVDIKTLTREELDAAWDLWFDLAQTTNDADPPYTHGVFIGTSTGFSQSAGPAEGPLKPDGITTE
jgi:hypothetical protein